MLQRYEENLKSQYNKQAFLSVIIKYAMDKQDTSG